MYDYRNDRRTFARFDVGFPARFKMSGMDRYEVAHCHNISGTGVGILIDQRLSPRAVMDLVLRFPDEKELCGLVRVIWSKQVRQGKWHVGLRFLKTDLTKLGRLLYG